MAILLVISLCIKIDLQNQMIKLLKLLPFTVRLLCVYDRDRAKVPVPRAVDLVMATKIDCDINKRIASIRSKNRFGYGHTKAHYMFD